MVHINGMLRVQTGLAAELHLLVSVGIELNCLKDRGDFRDGGANKIHDSQRANIEALKPDIIATGNIGCITQIASGTKTPILHTVELLDWAYGGPKPAKLAG